MHCRTITVDWLSSGTALSAKDSDLNQLQMFDLGEVMNVTTITTKGRTHTNNYVSGFMIKYGTNGRDFSDYKEVDGSPKLFDANRGKRDLVLSMLFSCSDLYIGGLPYVQSGLVIYENFTGCMKNLYLNHSNIFAANADRTGWETLTKLNCMDTTQSAA